MNPPRILFHGDAEKGQFLRRTALKQLDVLHEQMKFNDLKVYKRTLRFDDGSRIICDSSPGIDVIHIYVPEVVGEEESIQCCLQMGEYGIPFEFDDDNTPDTIVHNNNIAFIVLGGCPPFNYEITDVGLGYSWNSNGLQTLTSYNRTEQLDCVDGSCVGALRDFDVKVNVKVTDLCGTEVTAVILNEAGRWWSYVNECGVGADEVHENIDGDKKYRIMVTWEDILGSCANAYCAYTEYDYTHDCDETCTDLCNENVGVYCQGWMTDPNYDACLPGTYCCEFTDSSPHECWRVYGSSEEEPGVFCPEYIPWVTRVGNYTWECPF